MRIIFFLFACSRQYCVSFPLSKTTGPSDRLELRMMMSSKRGSAQCEPPVDYHTTTSPRFDFAVPEERVAGLQHLEEFGCVVCANVLTAQDVRQAKALFWEFMEGLGERLEGLYPGFKEEWQVKQGEPDTWVTWLGNRSTGIIGSYGMNQSPFTWFVRSRPSVKRCFEAVWETKDLICSFDAANAFRPWELRQEWKTQGGWYHVDQNPLSKPDKCCVQGLVSLYDVDAATGGLVVIPGSSQQFSAFGKRYEKRNGRKPPLMDFVPIPEGDPLLNTKGRLVHCRAGDMCLWDSRTVHCNAPGIAPPPQHNKQPTSPSFSSSSLSSAHKSFDSSNGSDSKSPSSSSSSSSTATTTTTTSSSSSSTTTASTTSTSSVLSTAPCPSPASCPGDAASSTPAVAPCSSSIPPSSASASPPAAPPLPAPPATKPHKETAKEERERKNKAIEASIRAQMDPSRSYDLLRLVAYVCMTPTSMATPEVLAQRLEAVKKNQGTSHWPHIFYPSGPAQPGFAANPYLTMELVHGISNNNNNKSWSGDSCSTILWPTRRCLCLTGHNDGTTIAVTFASVFKYFFVSDCHRGINLGLNFLKSSFESLDSMTQSERLLI
eukprot:g61512.t1